MSIFTIPNQGQIRAFGKYENQGELYETYNLDINNPFGKIQSSKTLTKILSEDVLGERIQAFAVYQKSGAVSPVNYYAISSEAVVTCNVNDDPTNPANWSEETGIATAGFGDETDAVVFNDFLLISRSQNILSWNDTADDDDWWTAVTSGAALTSGFPHTMHVHRGGQETLFVTDENHVRYYNTTSGHSTINLGVDQIAHCVSSGVEAIWVGTYSRSNDSAYVYEIYVGEQLDGTPIARNAYKIDGRAVLSITVVNNIPYIVTEKGNIQAFNGSGFVTVNSLPFANTSFILNNSGVGRIDDNNTERPVHPKGMQSHNDSIFINFNTTGESLGLAQDDYASRSASGIWEFNTTTGQIHHRYAFSAADRYGSKNIRYIAPLMIVDSPYTLLMAGAQVSGDSAFSSAAGNAGLYMEQESGYGYFVTSEIESGSVQDAHEAVYLKLKTLTDGQSVELKVRTSERNNIYGNGTLASPTVLNTTDDLTGIQIGDEVMSIGGTLAGKVGHITDISEGTNTTSITLDRSFGTTGDTGQFEITNFHLTSGGEEPGEIKKWGSFGTNPWIQFKVWLFGDIKIRQFMSKGNSKNEV